MNNQVQKREIEAASEAALDLGPFARLLGMAHWRRADVRDAGRAMRSLGSALALISLRVEREPVRAAHVVALRRQPRLDRARARQLRDGEEAPTMGPADLKALDRADAHEAKAVKGKRGALAIREEAARQRGAIAERLKAAADARRADMRLAQTVELDAAREGEDPAKVIEKRRGQTQVRLRTRDGLKLLHERGAFAPKDSRPPALARIEADRLLSVGLRYRDRYEIAQASLRSCLGSTYRVAIKRNVWVEATAARRRAALANQVRVLDIAVSTRLGPDALLALRMIAGEARTVNSITTARRRRGRLAQGLSDALTVIGDMLDGTA